ncbi:MAG: hypothetical protein L3J82_00130 [Planctomycetes bacterium]|nr:hypothetical protein [Planctomycetota bacterium]
MARLGFAQGSPEGAKTAMKATAFFAEARSFDRRDLELMAKVFILVSALMLTSCNHSSVEPADSGMAGGTTDHIAQRTTFAIELESAIDSLAILGGEKPEDAREHEKPFPDDFTMKPEGLKILIAHFFDPREMVSRLSLDPTDEERMGLAIQTHSIGQYLERVIQWDIKETYIKTAGAGLEYMHSADALTKFIKECDYDMTKMRARYKADLAKEKLENKNTNELED